MYTPEVCPKCEGAMQKGVVKGSAPQQWVADGLKFKDHFKSLPLVLTYACEKCGYIEEVVYRK